MSEEAAPKKKGKMPVIIVILAVLGGGGFFMMKGKGGEKKEPEIKLGEIVPLDEFLVNLAGGTSYLRTEIALHLSDQAKKADVDKQVPAVRDAIVVVLTSSRLDQIGTEPGKRRLKRRLAAAINDRLNALKPDEEKEEKDKDEEKDEKKGEKKEPAEPEHPDWDSDEGPVLKVYFSSFATQ